MYSFSFQRVLYVVGDVAMLFLALPITLTIRHFALPSFDALFLHAIPFILMAIVSILVFFSAGLYDTVTSTLRQELPVRIIGAQGITTVLAALFFFFVPFFSIAPKTNLLIYLIVSVLLVSLWRAALLVFEKTPKSRALIVGSTDEIRELYTECAANKRPFGEVTLISGDELSGAAVAEKYPTGNFTLVIDRAAPHLQRRIAECVQTCGERMSIVDATELYGKIFRRVPLSTLSYESFLSHGIPSHGMAIFVKRLFDVFLGIFVMAVFIVMVPFVAVLIKLDSRGPVFYKQRRIGKDWKEFSILKFRTMTETEHGVWVGETKNTVTRIGAILRKTSIDELPQVLSILAGHQSFIGPRSDIAGLGERLRDAIPFYELRYTALPGITGWAQVNQRYAPGNISPQSIEESRVRLTYDLYYIKHWSPFLDLSIALRTVKTLITRLLPS